MRNCQLNVRIFSFFLFADGFFRDSPRFVLLFISDGRYVVHAQTDSAHGPPGRKGGKRKGLAIQLANFLPIPLVLIDYGKFSVFIMDYINAAMKSEPVGIQRRLNSVGFLTNAQIIPQRCLTVRPAVRIFFGG